MPLTETEIAKDVAEAEKARAEAMAKDAKHLDEARIEETKEIIAKASEPEKPRQGRPPLPRDPATGEIIRAQAV
jgi:hypothetical protein